MNLFLINATFRVVNLVFSLNEFLVVCKNHRSWAYEILKFKKLLILLGKKNQKFQKKNQNGRFEPVQNRIWIKEVLKLVMSVSTCTV